VLLAAALVLLVGSVQCSGPTEPKVKPIATVSVSRGSVSLLVGQSAQLSATVADANGTTYTDRVVTWSSSDASKASVSSSGLVSAVAPGSATITATCEGKTSGASVTVAPVPVATVGISAATVQLLVGQTQQLTASSKDSAGGDLAGRSFAWQSSDATKASVSATGLVTAVAAGTATVTVTSEGKSATAAVTVIGLPAAVTLSSHLLVLAPNATALPTADVRDVNNRVVPGATLTYASRSPNVATVSSAGTVTGVAAGQATIVVSATGAAGTVADSLVVAVAAASTPVIGTSIATSLKGDTTLTVTITANWGTASPKVSSGVFVVTWPTAALTLTGASVGAQAAPELNQTAIATGTLQLAFADANGFTGGAEIAKLTFHVGTTVGTQGALTVTVKELGASDFTDLTAAVFSVLQRFSIR